MVRTPWGDVRHPREKTRAGWVAVLRRLGIVCAQSRRACSADTEQREGGELCGGTPATKSDLVSSRANSRSNRGRVTAGLVAVIAVLAMLVAFQSPERVEATGNQTCLTSQCAYGDQQACYEWNESCTIPEGVTTDCEACTGGLCTTATTCEVGGEACYNPVEVNGAICTLPEGGMWCSQCPVACTTSKCDDGIEDCYTTNSPNSCVPPEAMSECSTCRTCADVGCPNDPNISCYNPPGAGEPSCSPAQGVPECGAAGVCPDMCTTGTCADSGLQCYNAGGSPACVVPENAQGTPIPWECTNSCPTLTPTPVATPTAQVCIVSTCKDPSSGMPTIYCKFSNCQGMTVIGGSGAGAYYLDDCANCPGTCSSPVAT